MHLLRAVRHRMRWTVVLVLCVAARGGAQSDSLSHTVFVHGAGGYNASQWSYAINVLLNSYGFPFGYVEENIFNDVRSTDWRTYIQNSMVPDSTILVGYSLGGVASRDATQYVDALGLVSIGSPQTGAPVAASISSAAELIYALEYDLSLSLSIAFGEGLEALGWLGESLYWEVVALIDTWAYSAVQYLVEVGYGYIDTFTPYFQTDLPPGSSWMNQLPTGVSNSYTLSVRMSPGHLGGPLALLSEMSLEDADDAGEDIMYGGEQLAYWAYQTQFYIDWQHEHAWAAYDALYSAALLGTALMNYPYYWCGAVESGDVFGSCAPFASDGLIPTARQTFQGASDTPLYPGPAHTKELTHTSVIDFVAERLCAMSPTCG